MTGPVGTRHPIGDAVKALRDRVAAAAAARQVEGDETTTIRVDLGNPGEFEEWQAIGIALATAPVEPLDERPVTRTLGLEVLDFDIVCVALAWNGEDDREGRMFVALELVDLVRGELERDPTLGLPAVMSAHVDRAGLGWEPSDRGTQALVEFTVRVSAHRARR